MSVCPTITIDYGEVLLLGGSEGEKEAPSETQAPPATQKKNKQEIGESEFFQKLTENPDWIGIGSRIRGYRLVKGMSEQELAERLGINQGTIKYLEDGKSYKSQNAIWNFIRSENISIRWIYTGEGEYHSEDPPEYLPTTIVHKKGVGIRRSDARREAEEGLFSGDPLEFVFAVDAYKRLNRKPFPTWTEIYELFISLGYRKVATAKINPIAGLKA